MIEVLNCFTLEDHLSMLTEEIEDFACSEKWV
jgi:hypothetical protein